MVVRALVAAALLVPLGGRAAYAGATPLEQGTARFVAGDFAGAAPPLEQARRANPRDPDVALLLGIAYFRLDRRDEAEPLLAQAERDGDADTQASARVFLGLIADHRGDTDRARRYYALVARSPTSLGGSGRLLLQSDGPERWSLVGIARAGYDSNVALQPATGTVGPGNRNRGAGDAEMTLIGSATARPIPDVSFILDTTLLYRHYATDTDYDMFLDTLGATYTTAGVSNRLSLGYHFDASLLGGVRYELAHRADLSVRHWLSGDWGIAAHYAFTARNYASDVYAGYTGLYHEAGPELVWGSPHGPLEGLAGYVFERQSTDDMALASTGHGGRAQLRASLSDAVELRASLLATRRGFDVDRTDTHVQGDAALFIDASSAFGLVVGATLVRNASTDASFDYTKWTIFAGVLAARWAE